MSTYSTSAQSIGARSLAAVDLSWTAPFHTVRISRWSEPPGPDGAPNTRWRVTVGAYGDYVDTDAPTLEAAMGLCKDLVRAHDKLRMLL